MRNATLVLIALSALGFVFAVVGTLLGRSIMGIASEGFSRACTNLALIAIALLLVEKKRSAGK
jgi:hypothetical protein